jgi:membrane associated rhomboid family serine protease
MGLADREYARRSSGRGFDPTATTALGRGMRGWSANTWLMVICIAVFFLDMLLASAGWVPTLPMGRVSFVADSSLLRGAASIPAGSVAGQIVVPRDVVLAGADVNLLAVPLDRVPEPERQGLQVLHSPGQPSMAVVGIERFRKWLPLKSIGHFSTGKGFLELEVWRLVTFQFLHANLNHLIFNMIGLFFFGSMVESMMGARRYLSFYLACGIAGALLYLTLNFLGSVLHIRAIGLLNYDAYVPLIGASGGVFGVLMAAAHYSRPGDKLMLLFVIPVPIKIGAYGLVILQAIELLYNAENAGGSAAHIGGALAGMVLVRRLSVLDNFLDIFGKRTRGKPGRSARAGGDSPAISGRDQRRVDEILEKVSQQGIQSLTDEERAFLDRVSRDR